MLRLVASGAVTYDPSTGHWRIRTVAGDGQVHGWEGRTLAALRRAEYIMTSGRTTTQPRVVTLTARGREALP
jgi:hypothetical protein